MTARYKEQRMWDRLKEAALFKLRMWRVENQLQKLPDVIGVNPHGVTFWLELKALDKWPARDSTLPLKNAFEKGQIPFSRDWGMWKGHAFVLLRVGTYEWYLYDVTPTQPERDIRTMTKIQLLMRACCISMDGPQTIIDYLSSLEPKAK